VQTIKSKRKNERRFIIGRCTIMSAELSLNKYEGLNTRFVQLSVRMYQGLQFTGEYENSELLRRNKRSSDGHRLLNRRLRLGSLNTIS
jgi:hypothetical protein